MATEKTHIDTHYVKSDGFRTSFATGIFGGVTPNNLIDINFYSERGPIPKKITFEVDSETGHIIKELERDTKVGIIREVNCGVLIDVGMAKSIVQWLNDRIQQVEETSLEK